MRKLKQLNWLEYSSEFLGTAILLFFGLSAVVFFFASSLPMVELISSASTRRLLTGLLFAGSAALFAISPPGKLSGAHINPAVSLAFWLQGKMYNHDLMGYMVAQFIGGIFGIFLLTQVWGEHAATVNYGMTLPGQGYSLWFVFFAEVFITGLLVLALFIFLGSKNLMKWTPLMVWLLVAGMVWIEAPISGTSLNPARSFAPALASGLWEFQWLYFVAPTLGSISAVGIYRVLTKGQKNLATCKLCHDPRYRCIFKNITARHHSS